MRPFLLSKLEYIPLTIRRVLPQLIVRARPLVFRPEKFPTIGIRTIIILLFVHNKNKENFRKTLDISCFLCYNINVRPMKISSIILFLSIIVIPSFLYCSACVAGQYFFVYFSLFDFIGHLDEKGLTICQSE